MVSTSEHGQSERNLQQQVELLKQQLAQAQRLTALGELVSTTTHEFNNVLMTIINYAKLGMRHKDNATREKAFEKILAGQQAGGQDHHHRAGPGPQPQRRPGADQSAGSWSKTRSCCWNGR